MSDPQPQGIQFQYRKRSAGWIFEAEPRMFPPPILLPESQTWLLDLDRPLPDYQASRLDRREFGVFHLYKDNHGTPERPLYNAVPGFESRRGMLVSATHDYPNLMEMKPALWPDVPASYEKRLRIYFIAETQIVSAVEELWNHPRQQQWITEAAYAVVPDSILRKV